MPPRGSPRGRSRARGNPGTRSALDSGAGVCPSQEATDKCTRNVTTTRESGFTLVELMIVIVIIGLLAAIAIPNFVNFSDRAKAANVKQNCHTVQIVAEDYSVVNEGTYAGSTAEVNVVGSSIIDLLPQSQPLVNPWTGNNSEPVDGVAATPGQTGYRPINQNGTNVGYVIEGYGRDAIVISLSNG